MRRVTIEEFRIMVEALSACTAVSIETVTEPKLLKKSRVTGEACGFEQGDVDRKSVV